MVCPPALLQTGMRGGLLWCTDDLWDVCQVAEVAYSELDRVWVCGILAVGDQSVVLCFRTAVSWAMLTWKGRNTQI